MQRSSAAQVECSPQVLVQQEAHNLVALVQQEARNLDLVVRQQVQQVRTAESVRQLAETRSYLEVLYLARCLSRNDLA